MKRYLTLGVLALALGFTGWFVQRRDIASTMNAYTTLVPALRANSAATGRTVDLSGYSGAFMAVIADSIDSGQPSLYVVLQDSGTAWAAVDSVLVDSASASNGAANWQEANYTGANRYLRALQRASGSAADSVATTVLIVRGGCRVQPC